MNDRRLSVAAFLLMVTLFVCRTQAKAETPGFEGEISFSNGEVFQYKAPARGVAVVVDGAGSAYLLKHDWIAEEQRFELRAFLLSLRGSQVAQLPVLCQGNDFFVQRVQGRRAQALFSIHSTATGFPEPEDNPFVGICCQSCNGRIVCGTEVVTSCGSCAADNMY